MTYVFKYLPFWRVQSCPKQITTVSYFLQKTNKTKHTHTNLQQNKITTTNKTNPNPTHQQAQVF